MRIPVLAVVAGSAALLAAVAAAQGWTEDRDATVVTVRECPLPARGVVRCQNAVTPPVKERVVRVLRREEAAAWRGNDLYVDHGRLKRRDEGERDMWEDRGRAIADRAIHPEDEDRQGSDDHEYAQRNGGLWPDTGDARSHLYGERPGRAFEPGERWLGSCGCGPARAAT